MTAYATHLKHDDIFLWKRGGFLLAYPMTFKCYNAYIPKGFYVCDRALNARKIRGEGARTKSKEKF